MARNTRGSERVSRNISNRKSRYLYETGLPVFYHGQYPMDNIYDKVKIYIRTTGSMSDSYHIKCPGVDITWLRKRKLKVR